MSSSRSKIKGNKHSLFNSQYSSHHRRSGSGISGSSGCAPDGGSEEGEIVPHSPLNTGGMMPSTPEEGEISTPTGGSGSYRGLHGGGGGYHHNRRDGSRGDRMDSREWGDRGGGSVPGGGGGMGDRGGGGPVGGGTYAAMSTGGVGGIGGGPPDRERERGGIDRERGGGEPLRRSLSREPSFDLGPPPPLGGGSVRRSELWHPPERSPKGNDRGGGLPGGPHQSHHPFSHPDDGGGKKSIMSPFGSYGQMSSPSSASGSAGDGPGGGGGGGPPAGPFSAAAPPTGGGGGRRGSFGDHRDRDRDMMLRDRDGLPPHPRVFSRGGGGVGWAGERDGSGGPPDRGLGGPGGGGSISPWERDRDVGRDRDPRERDVRDIGIRERDHPRDLRDPRDIPPLHHPRDRERDLAGPPGHGGPMDRPPWERAHPPRRGDDRGPSGGPLGGPPPGALLGRRTSGGDRDHFRFDPHHGHPSRDRDMHPGGGGVLPGRVDVRGRDGPSGPGPRKGGIGPRGGSGRELLGRGERDMQKKIEREKREREMMSIYGRGPESGGPDIRNVPGGQPGGGGHLHGELRKGSLGGAISPPIARAGAGPLRKVGSYGSMGSGVGVESSGKCGSAGRDPSTSGPDYYGPASVPPSVSVSVGGSGLKEQGRRPGSKVTKGSGGGDSRDYYGPSSVGTPVEKRERSTSVGGASAGSGNFEQPAQRSKFPRWKGSAGGLSGPGASDDRVDVKKEQLESAGAVGQKEETALPFRQPAGGGSYAEKPLVGTEGAVKEKSVQQAGPSTSVSGPRLRLDHDAHVRDKPKPDNRTATDPEHGKRSSHTDLVRAKAVARQDKVSHGERERTHEESSVTREEKDTELKDTSLVSVKHSTESGSAVGKVRCSIDSIQSEVGGSAVTDKRNTFSAQKTVVAAEDKLDKSTASQLRSPLPTARKQEPRQREGFSRKDEARTASISGQSGRGVQQQQQRAVVRSKGNGADSRSSFGVSRGNGSTDGGGSTRLLELPMPVGKVLDSGKETQRRDDRRHGHGEQASRRGTEKQGHAKRFAKQRQTHQEQSGARDATEDVLNKGGAKAILSSKKRAPSSPAKTQDPDSSKAHIAKPYKKAKTLGNQSGEDKRKQPKDSPASKIMSPLTCASLGNSDKVVKAERAVHVLSEIVSRPSLNTSKEESSGALLLPTKQLILKGLSGLDSQLKARQDETDKIKAEIKKAVELEESEKEREKKRLEEEKIEKQRQLEEAERERQEKLRREEEAKERKRREMERRRQLERRRERESHQRELESKKEEVKTKAEEIDRVCEKTKEEETMKLTKAMGEHIEIVVADLDAAIAQARNDLDETVRNAATAKTKTTDTEAAYKATVQAAAAEELLAEEFVSSSGRSGDSVTRISQSEDPSEGLNELVASILASNRNRALEAQKETLSLIPYSPVPNNVGISSSQNSPPASEESSVSSTVDSEEDGQSRSRTIGEWSNITRQVTGPADALYTTPSDNPFYKYHARNHALIRPLVLEHARGKKRKLTKRWEELGHEYIIRQQGYAKIIDPDEESSAADRRAGGGTSSRSRSILGESSGNRSNSNPYRRARRGNGAGPSLSSIGSDVVRSEYEQEQIIAELTAKEAMEKRIAHGGSSLPRQRCLVEKQLFATFRDSLNGRRILDLSKEEEEREHINPWSDFEKCIFLDRFLQHPKDFRKIASFLRNKSTKECVAFYYNSKKTVPFKAALKEHHMRRKRRSDACWDATVQAALSMGAVITAGTSAEKPLLFSLPVDDNTYHTRHFHPMKRELFDKMIDDRTDEVFDAVSRPDDAGVQTAEGGLFSLDNSQRKFLRTASHDSLSGIKRKAGNGDVEMSSVVKVVRSPSASSVNDAGSKNICDDAAVESSITGAMRKAPQKWSQAEKRRFFETVEKHGKNWKILVSAVGSKSISQIKNYYYDHKKQFGKQQQYGLMSANEESDVSKTGNISPPTLSYDQGGNSGKNENPSSKSSERANSFDKGEFALDSSNKNLPMNKGSPNDDAFVSGKEIATEQPARKLIPAENRTRREVGVPIQGGSEYKSHPQAVASWARTEQLISTDTKLHEPQRQQDYLQREVQLQRNSQPYLEQKLLQEHQRNNQHQDNLRQEHRQQHAVHFTPHSPPQHVISQHGHSQHQLLTSLPPSVMPWVAAAQAAHAHAQAHAQAQAAAMQHQHQQFQEQQNQQLQQQQHQQEVSGMSSSLQDWVDGGPQLQHVSLAMALRQAGHCHDGFALSPSTHLGSLAMAGLAAINASSVPSGIDQSNEVGGSSRGAPTSESEMAGQIHPTLTLSGGSSSSGRLTNGTGQQIRPSPSPSPGALALLARAVPRNEVMHGSSSAFVPRNANPNAQGDGRETS